jgi:molybdopterin-containing oxidoreductase family iron-sulfur binding subunit
MSDRKNLVPELAAIQEQLGATRGKKYWRSLEELANTEAFHALMQREFPEQASV